MGVRDSTLVVDVCGGVIPKSEIPAPNDFRLLLCPFSS